MQTPEKVIVLLQILFLSGFTQDRVSLSGHVFNESNQPLSRVEVSLAHLALTALTDHEGFFSIELAPTQVRTKSIYNLNVHPHTCDVLGRQNNASHSIKVNRLYTSYALTPLIKTMAAMDSDVLDTLIFNLDSYETKKVVIRSYQDSIGHVTLVRTVPRLSYLKTSGTVITNAQGDTIDLRGINVGGWLVTETWMNGFTDDTDLFSKRFSLETLEERFGEDSASILIETWRSHFITTSDLDSMKALGINLLRVPFGYRNLQNKDGSWKLKPDGSIDFGLMDWIVDQAEKRGIYVIFDYHIWKGQEEGRTSSPDSAIKNTTA